MQCNVLLPGINSQTALVSLGQLFLNWPCPRVHVFRRLNGRISAPLCCPWAWPRAVSRPEIRAAHDWNQHFPHLLPPDILSSCTRPCSQRINQTRSRRVCKWCPTVPVRYCLAAAAALLANPPSISLVKKESHVQDTRYCGHPFTLFGRIVLRSSCALI